MRRLLSTYTTHDDEVHSWDPLSWAQAEHWTRRLPAKTNLVVPRSHLPQDPPYGKSVLGRRRGASRQFRCARAKNNLHVKEFADHWVMHVDAWNPHTNMVQHLLLDHGFKQFLHVVDLLSQADEQPVPVGS